MLVLDETLLIGRGKVRYCYRHPKDASLVVKVPAGIKKEQLQANRKELQGYQFLLARHGRLDCISHCHGLIDTNLGQGLLCDCIRDADGAISATIWDIVNSSQPIDVEYILHVTRMLCDQLVHQDVWLFDLNLQNIALVREVDNSYRPIILDLKGRYDNKEFIPLSSYIGFLARKKRDRRLHQLLERVSGYRGSGGVRG